MHRIRSRARSLIALCAVVVGPLLVSVARAQSSASKQAPDSSLEEYRRAYDAMDRAEWAEARRLLLNLWGRVRTYDVAASLAQVEYQLLNFPAAARYMAFAIANVAPKEKFENLERYRAALREIRAWVGTLHLTAREPGAEVRVNGELVGKGPFDAEVFVEPGTYVVEARIGNARVASKTVSLTAGETRRTPLELPSLGALDARKAEPLSKTSRDTNVAAKSTRLGAPDGAAGESFLDANETERSLVPVYVGSALAAAGVTMAVGFGVAAHEAQERAELLSARLGPSGCASGAASPSDCRAAREAVERQRNRAAWSTVGLGVGAVSVLATLGYWLVWPEPSPKHHKSSFQPNAALSASGAELSFTGNF